MDGFETRGGALSGVGFVGVGVLLEAAGLEDKEEGLEVVAGFEGDEEEGC